MSRAVDDGNCLPELQAQPERMESEELVKEVLRLRGVVSRIRDAADQRLFHSDEAQREAPFAFWLLRYSLSALVHGTNLAFDVPDAPPADDELTPEKLRAQFVAALEEVLFEVMTAHGFDTLAQAFNSLSIGEAADQATIALGADIRARLGARLPGAIMADNFGELDTIQLGSVSVTVSADDTLIAGFRAGRRVSEQQAAAVGAVN